MNSSIFETALAALPAIFREQKPIAAVVLGSGWNRAVESLPILAEVSYADIPGYGASTVIGHAGRLLLCEAPKGGRVLVFCGRRHWYEGCDWEPVVMPAMLSHKLGAPVLLLTNAAGGIRETYRPGDIVAITDHIRMNGLSPLRGPADPAFGPRFPDQCHVYDPALTDLVCELGRKQDVFIEKGVYMFAGGPAYETPAEIRAFRILGADLAGMSTVPEAQVASAIGMRVCAVSFVSNMAAGLNDERLDGDDVVSCANAHANRLSRLVLDFLAALGR